MSTKYLFYVAGGIILFSLTMLHPLGQIVMGVVTALMIVIFILALVSPLYAPALTNKPMNGQRSGFHLFTFIEPGQVKLIERGESLVRMVMNTDGKSFQGGADPVERWTIVDGVNDPLEGVNPFIKPWARYVFKTTGAVFTGIYPYQQVREYRLERTKIKRKEPTGDRQVGMSNLHLEVTEDYSDHYRLRQFLYPMHITGAETKDKIPLDIIGVAKMEVKNPHRAAYGTDRWDAAVVNLTTNAIGEKTKTLTLDKSLTASSADGAKTVAKAVKGIQSDLKDTGIEIGGFDVLEINPNLDEEGLRILAAEALAKQQAKATREDGAARSDVIRSINAANKEAGELSIKTMETEAMVRAAEAAGKGGGIVILTAPGTNTIDPAQAAILGELKQLNKKG